MALKTTARRMVEEATAAIESVPVEEALDLVHDETVLFVDIRDVRELDREGMIPGACHAPRGMLEFWVDPESPYHRDVFASDRKFILYCAAAARSALATKTLQDMGFGPVAQLAGGFAAWKAAGGDVAERPRKS